MKTYDQFLEFSASKHYEKWLNSYAFNDDELEICWGVLGYDIINTAAVIYDEEPYTVNQDFKTKLKHLYGNPLSGENGIMQELGYSRPW